MYRSLLVTDRMRPSSRGAKGLIEEAESDRARVLYSSSFRRLQRKTQVFPLEDNAAVRSRLTHSLEVAHVGRFLASMMVQKAHDTGVATALEIDSEVQHALTVTVEVACLLHDIGNPAFGHFGEGAIAAWFSKNPDALSKTKLDMAGFDGNPQGLRIIASLAGADRLTGMNLTLTQLASTIKYQVVADEHALLGDKKRYKKFGAFQTESDVIGRIRDKFSMGPQQRFPLAYLMEAADDISYCLSDIEDGVEKRIIRYDNFIQSLLIAAEAEPAVTSLIEDAKKQAERAPDVDRVVSFRSYLVRHLVSHATERYLKKHDSILDGTLDELIDASAAEGKLLATIKSVVRSEVYSDESIQSLELAGSSVISGLLDRFGVLLKVNRNALKGLLSPGARVRGLDVEKRLLDLIAPSHKQYYASAAEGKDDDMEMLLRSHMIVDYISGMTDPFALRMHQKLSGIRL